MVQNDPAKKKLLGSKVEILSFLLGKSVQGLFVDPKTHEGVGMKARGWLQKNRNTKIGWIGCSQVFVNLNITNYNRKYRYFSILAGKIFSTLRR